jgi:thiol-disulfide isomerase/thioredoxin
MLSIILTGCQTQKNSSISIFPYDYDLWLSSRLAWEEIFTPTAEEYYIYFYAPLCGHCQSIKEEMLLFYLQDDITMYVIFDDDEIVYGPLRSEEELLGIKTLDDLSIPGVPTLILIKAHAIAKFLVGAKIISAFLFEKQNEKRLVF